MTLNAFLLILLLGASPAFASGLIRVAIVEQTDFLFDRGTVFADQAEVFRMLGRAEESRAALGRALGEFERKGDLVSSARVRSELGA